MADQKISQLTELTNPNSNDVIPIVSGGETKKITVANLAVAGSSGTSGSNGSSGTSGSNGSSGTSGSSGSNGSNGSSGTSGNTGSSGTSGTSSTSGYVDNDWLFFRPTTATIPTTGNNFVLSGSTTSNGSVSYNATNGVFTLAANKTYRLSGVFALGNTAGNNEINYQWINVTASNSNIGNTGGLLVLSNNLPAAWQPAAEAIIVTTGTTQVALKCTFSNSTSGFNTAQCYMAISQINGWSGSSGTSGINGTSGSSGTSGSNGSSGTSGTSGVVSYTGLITSGSLGGTQSITGSLNLSGSLNIISGSVTMQDRPAFRVYGAGGGTAATTVLSGSMTIVDYSQGSAWNNSNGTFTAPVAGLYQVNLVARCSSNSGPTAQVIVYKNNTTTSPSPNGTTQVMLEWAANTTANHIGGSTITKLAVGDTLKAIVTVGTISFDGNDNFSAAYIG